jgi:hypothetical protein
MSYNIVKVKQFLKSKGGNPQFDVIQRRDKGESWNAHFESGNKELDFKYVKTIIPETEDGLIQIVKRISDDRIFHQGDLVEGTESGTCFIVSFSEDLIHCKVVFLDEEEYELEINDIESLEDLIADDIEAAYEADLGEDEEETTD